jgi:hypothetical protein
MAKFDKGYRSMDQERNMRDIRTAWEDKMCILQKFLKYIFKLIKTSWKGKTR